MRIRERNNSADTKVSAAGALTLTDRRRVTAPRAFLNQGPTNQQEQPQPLPRQTQATQAGLLLCQYPACCLFSAQLLLLPSFPPLSLHQQTRCRWWQPGLPAGLPRQPQQLEMQLWVAQDHRAHPSPLRCLPPEPAAAPQLQRRHLPPQQPPCPAARSRRASRRTPPCSGQTGCCPHLQGGLGLETEGTPLQNPAKTLALLQRVLILKTPSRQQVKHNYSYNILYPLSGRMQGSEKAQILLQPAAKSQRFG